MHNIWHSACLRALERSLSRRPAVRPLRRVFSSSPPWSALPKKDIAMEDYPCDVIRYCAPPFHGLSANNVAETSLSLHISVRNQRREFGRTTDSDPNRPWQVDAGGQVCFYPAGFLMSKLILARLDYSRYLNTSCAENN